MTFHPPQNCIGGRAAFRFLPSAFESSGSTGAPAAILGLQRPILCGELVGTDPYVRGGQSPVDGPWLDGTHNHKKNGPWYTYGKTTTIVKPSPAGLWVLIDENARSLNDAGFAVTMVESKFLDGPGSYHGFACGIAFADGHSEIHKWKDGRTLWTTGAATYNPTNQDVAWLQERTSARK